LRSARATHSHGYVSIFLFLCNHNPVLPSIITYHPVCNKINTTGATCGAETAYPFGTPKFIPVFGVVCVVRSSVFFVMFCRLLYGLFLYNDKRTNNDLQNNTQKTKYKQHESRCSGGNVFYTRRDKRFMLTKAGETYGEWITSQHKSSE
jgi:hypothetical protein